MRRIIYLLAGIALLFSACNDDDPYCGEPVQIFDEPAFDVSTVVGKKQAALYDKYGIVILDKLNIGFYLFDWNTVNNAASEPGEVGYHFTEADPAYVLDAVNYLEEEIFPIFGEDALKKYFPRNIQLLDMCGYLTKSNLIEGNEPEPRLFPGCGDVMINFVALAGVSGEFETMKGTTDLKLKWTSLFFEKILAGLPHPKAFADLYKKGYDTDRYGTIRLDAANKYGFIQVYRKSAYLPGIHKPETSVNKVSLEQDFGDFAAAILVCNEDELATIAGISALVAEKLEAMKKYLASIGFIGGNN